MEHVSGLQTTKRTRTPFGSRKPHRLDIARGEQHQRATSRALLRMVVEQLPTLACLTLLLLLGSAVLLAAARPGPRFNLATNLERNDDGVEGGGNENGNERAIARDPPRDAGLSKLLASAVGANQHLAGAQRQVVETREISVNNASFWADSDASVASFLTYASALIGDQRREGTGELVEDSPPEPDEADRAEGLDANDAETQDDGERAEAVSSESQESIKDEPSPPQRRWLGGGGSAVSETVTSNSSDCAVIPKVEGKHYHVEPEFSFFTFEDEIKQNYFEVNQSSHHPSEERRLLCWGHGEKYPKKLTWTCANVLMIPTDLPSLISLHLTMTTIETICAYALQPYKETLRDFSIESAPRLHTIERDVFANLTRLRVVYIFQAPRLLAFNSLHGHLPSLASIRIQQTGLKTWPDLSGLHQRHLLVSIDLDSNQIETLGSKPINIRAETVNLEFNQISSIGEHIFDGSEIGALSLSGNKQLTFIHENAFANLKNLMKLDLSGTSVTRLPEAGLFQLRFLKIQNNYALKQIPSIFVFPVLEEAQLTYSFHCCSFRYPKTHDPNAYQEHVRLQNEINAICEKRQQSLGSQFALADGDQAAKGAELADERQQFRREAEAADQTATSTTTAMSTSPPSSSAASTSDSTSSQELSSTTPAIEFEGSFFDADRQQPTGVAHQTSSPQTTTTKPTVAFNATSDNASAAATAGLGNSSSQSPGSLKKQWLLQNIECGELAQRQEPPKIICTPTPDAFNPCEDIMGYPVLRVAVWLVVACSIFGNMSVIVVLLGIFRRLSVPKFLQLNLAIGDLFMGVYLAMLAGADIVTVGTYFNYALDWQHGLGCQLAGASSLFASQLSIFTLIVITFERYYTITYSIDLNMRLQLGWAARIMLIGWSYAFASAMLPIFGNINSYSMTSICLPLRTRYKLDMIFILVLIVIDSCAFIIIFICYLRMYLLILKQKTEATLKERTVAMRMALLVLTDFCCWAPIIFFSLTAVMGQPLISVTNMKILIVFFYPLNSMANPFLYVLSTRQYRRDLNYLIGRWRHWRKNLFKNREDKDYSFNNSQRYGKYPFAMNAHLNAVAAVTGVASHLHGYRIPIEAGAGARGAHQYAGGQQVELIRFGPSDDDTNNARICGQPGRHCRHNRCKHHHHHHHHHHHRHSKQQCRQPNGQIAQVACAIELDGQQAADGSATTAQYIIRHQILPERRATSSHRTLSTTRMVSYTRAISPGSEVASNRSKQQPSNSPKHTVKLGLVIDEQERISSLADESLEDSREAAARLAPAGANNGHDETGAKTIKPVLESAAQHYHIKKTRFRARDKHDAMGTQQRAAMTKICMCGQQTSHESGSGDNGTQKGPRIRSKSVNWTARLNIRRDRKSEQKISKSVSPSKSAQTTVTTDANTNTSTTRSCTDQETTATPNSFNETTTTTGNEVSQACSDEHLDEHHRHRRRHKHDHHHHHHHHHHRHHHRRHHQRRCRCRRESGDNGDCCRDGSCCSRASDRPPRVALERITESSNTERSSTPKQQTNRAGQPRRARSVQLGDQLEAKAVKSKCHQHQHQHRRRHHHRHCNHDGELEVLRPLVNSNEKLSALPLRVEEEILSEKLTKEEEETNDKIKNGPS